MVCTSEVDYRLVSMYSAPIFRQFICIHIKYDDAVVSCEVFGISLYLCNEVPYNSLGVDCLINRKLQPYCAMLFQHFREIGAHLVV